MKWDVNSTAPESSGCPSTTRVDLGMRIAQPFNNLKRRRAERPH